MLPTSGQYVWPLTHVEPHTPPLQTCWAPHTTPQPPQLLLSVPSAAQYAGLLPTAGQYVWPLTHVEPHTPPLQTCWAPHTTPQPPQLLLSVPSAAQYAALPSAAGVCLAGHARRAADAAAADLLGAAGDAAAAQLLLWSVVAMPSAAGQYVWPVTQVEPQTPLPQTCWAPQVTPQPPQLLLSVPVAAQ